MLHLLLLIAYADGEIVLSEESLIERIAAALGVNRLDLDSIRAPYTKKQDINWAYKTLEIEPPASEETIKKAYREMAKKYHPDKVNDLGEEVKKAATEKFRSINEAYESLKKKSSS